MKDTIEQIQKIVNADVDGIYGPQTATAIISYLKIRTTSKKLRNLTKAIQKYVGTWTDGIFGPKTANATLYKLTHDEEDPDIEITSKYPEVFKQTPNISARSIKPLGVVLHHSDGHYAGSVDWCLRPESKVSYHVLIDLDGSRTVLAKDHQRAWHAGRSSFKGKRGCNDFLLGLSFSLNTNYRELNQDEIESACEYIIPRLLKYDWPKDLSTITTHRFISPGRKNDVDVRAEHAVLAALKQKLAGK